jgi:2-keto-3-deoxy-L-rhamnonate aldolase RhmA
VEIPAKNRMKAKIAAGGLAVGMIVRLMRNVEIALMAKSAGFDCLYMDLEHSSFSLETISQISITATALGITPLVRVPALNAADISRTLEVGAQGIIVPHLETKAQAEQVVEAALFPPTGQRSLLAANPHMSFQTRPAAETMQLMNREVLVAGMIESVKAVENADSIAGVDGVDLLIVGTNDLCNSLGAPGQLDHPRVQEAYAHVYAACKSRGKYLGVGGLNTKPELAKQFIAMGARYVSAGSDTGFLMSSAQAAVRTFGGDSR